jgi:hypothetical protein
MLSLPRTPPPPPVPMAGTIEKKVAGGIAPCFHFGQFLSDNSCHLHICLVPYIRTHTKHAYEIYAWNLQYSARSPRSPDLNPLHFYLWGHLRSLLYAAAVDNEEALHRRTVDACQTIHNYPGISQRMRRSMRRVEACIESRGDILSTYYKCTLSFRNNKLNVSGHMLILFFLVCGTSEGALGSAIS